jgi:hypothetical protein
MPYISEKVIKKHENNYDYNNIICKTYENYIYTYCSEIVNKNQEKHCKIINDIFLKNCSKDKKMF